MGIVASAENQEHDIAGDDLHPTIYGDDTVGWHFEDAVEACGVVYAAPVVWVDDEFDERGEVVEGVGDVDENDDDADDEEANEPGLGCVSGGDEADEFATIVVKTVG